MEGYHSGSSTKKGARIVLALKWLGTGDRGTIMFTPYGNCGVRKDGKLLEWLRNC